MIAELSHAYKPQKFRGSRSYRDHEAAGGRRPGSRRGRPQAPVTAIPRHARAAATARDADRGRDVQPGRAAISVRAAQHGYHDTAAPPGQQRHGGIAATPYYRLVAATSRLTGHYSAFPRAVCG